LAEQKRVEKFGRKKLVEKFGKIFWQKILAEKFGQKFQPKNSAGNFRPGWSLSRRKLFSLIVL
jgi:hypothetical protein